jgi:hypothetical protein
VLVTTGRAGFFRSENRGARWHRSMEGLVAPNGVSPFPVFLLSSLRFGAIAVDPTRPAEVRW